MFDDLWAYIDGKQKMPFMSMVRDDEKATVIRQYVPTGIITWISDAPVDVNTAVDIEKREGNDRMVLSYAVSDTDAGIGITNVPDGYEMEIAETAVVYESENTRRYDLHVDGASVRKADVSDVDILRASCNADDVGGNIDYASQFADAIEYGGDVYALEYKGDAASYLSLSRYTSERFGYDYLEPKMIYTIPCHRSRGFASLILCSVMDMHAGKPFLYTVDSVDNDASCALAESYGFERIGYNRMSVFYRPQK